ncbi:isocitrate/isopropylmalate dehydrogenase family protein [Pseudomonas fulva]|nr:isocitrate/isopropylmalate family dehydrogenase [Pseudomonas fulva]MBF8781982.1 isocitrate/isopropylmalate dehydrogenase family protein [Pseudomonas fulva]
MSGLQRVCVLPGDGIGIEVTEAVLPVFQALALPIELRLGEIGWACWRGEGDSVPAATWQAIGQSDATLLGAITSKPLHEAQAELPVHLRSVSRHYLSPVIQLRQRLGLFANVRPIDDILDERFRFTVIRENTEGLYAGLDFAHVPEAVEPLLEQRERHGAAWTRTGREDAAVTLRLQTRHGVARLLRFAFEHAVANGFDRLTLADKPNVLRHSGAFVRQILEETAADYPQIHACIENVDAVAMWMVRRPERFGVIVAENMFGDILSDLGAGLMGGLGLAPSANFGEGTAYFEPVHGSAPTYAGFDKANPSAMFLSTALMLDHLGHGHAAQAIRAAVKQVMRSDLRTYDLGGRAGTREVAGRIIELSQSLCARAQSSVAPATSGVPA